ncbi:MAG TPA: hypothetical protein VFA10_10130 [Ktedonobacteraceae bacterium]|nr:hypothetical protein [Ktedonobacteraceae bacterium]
MFQVVHVNGFAEGGLDLALLEGIADRRDLMQLHQLWQTGIERLDILRNNGLVQGWCRRCCMCLGFEFPGFDGQLHAQRIYWWTQCGIEGSECRGQRWPGDAFLGQGKGAVVSWSWESQVASLCSCSAMREAGSSSLAGQRDAIVYVLLVSGWMLITMRTHPFLELIDIQ